MRSTLPLPLLTLFLSLANAESTVIVTETDSAPTATSTSYTSSSDFKSTLLYAHNFYRTEYNASALVWNATSAKYAAHWASACNFKHSEGPTGENLAAGYANTTSVVDSWAGERSSYSFSHPGFSEKTGHFTQIVWKGTTSLGCAVKACDNEDTPGEYVVCEYYPAGNIVGKNAQGQSYFALNVQKQVKGTKDGTVEEGMGSAGNRVKAGFEDAWGGGLVFALGVWLALGIV